MPVEKTDVPDAWDDDWETLADKPAEFIEDEPKQPVKVSKKERRAQHAEEQRKLWESAESPDQPIFLQAKDAAPLASEFKAPMKLLSRKPPAAKPGQISGDMGQLSIADDEDSEEEERRRAAESFAERQAKAQREREEKQRKYAEARERILGSPSEEPQSRSSSKGGQHRSRNSSRGMGRGKAEPDGVAPHDQSPGRNGVTKRLYDPNYTSKPHSLAAQRAVTGDVRLESSAESQHIRAPRGPDASGSAGFGAASRGKLTGSAT